MVYFINFTFTTRLSAHFGSQGVWSDRRNVQTSETPYNDMTWYQDGSHTKRADRETTGLFKTG